MRTFHVYIMTNQSGTLYVGVTSNLKRRVHEHKSHTFPGFTAKYNLEHLVYVELIRDAASAMNREKQIKHWRREKKLALINALNPQWNDLSEGWYD